MLSGHGRVRSARSSVSSKNFSMPAGVKVRIIRIGSSEKLRKQWRVPFGTFTKSPGRARMRSSPRRKVGAPSST
jgi:hypothetical protein